MANTLTVALRWSEQADGALKAGQVPGGANLAHDLYCVHLTLMAAKEQVYRIEQRMDRGRRP